MWQPRIGMTLIFCGTLWAAGWEFWRATRVDTPLFTPVSLAPGQTSAPFVIQTAGPHRIGILFESDARFDTLSFAAAWAVTDSNGRVVARGPGDTGLPLYWDRDHRGRELGVFEAAEGPHSIELEIQPDAAIFNPHSPRLVIQVDPDVSREFDARARRAWLQALFASALGFCLLLRWFVLQRRAGRFHLRMQREPTANGVAAMLILAACAVFPAALWLSAVITAACLCLLAIHHLHWTAPLANWAPKPNYGLLAAFIYAMSVLALQEMKALAYVPSVGLPLRIAKPYPSAARIPGLDPIAVRIKNKAVCVNAHCGEHFEPALRQELQQRPPDWPVYLSADADIEWGRAAGVIDRIRAAGAEVALEKAIK